MAMRCPGSPVGTAESAPMLRFSRPYGTGGGIARVPSTEVLGYLSGVPTGTRRAGTAVLRAFHIVSKRDEVGEGVAAARKWARISQPFETRSDGWGTA